MRAILVLLALLTVCLALAPAAQARVLPCRHTGEQVEAKTREVLVLSDYVDRPDTPQRRIVACIRATGRRRTIDVWDAFQPNAGEYAAMFRVRGRQVAFVHGGFCTVCQGSDFEEVRVVDLSTGRSRAVRDLHDALPPHTNPRVRSVAVNACGAVAAVTAPWLPEPDRPNLDGNRQLRASFGDGPTQLLDTGLVELASVRVTPTRVRWRRDGIWRELRLPAPCTGSSTPALARTAGSAASRSSVGPRSGSI